jgi:NAD(P)-dependent dehydrogenase (short-subunit alcohol dehydrogenase family)
MYFEVQRHLLKKKITQMNDLKEKVIVVTGSAQGLGAAICTELSAAGALVIATDINKEKLVNVEQAIKKANGKIRTYSMDVANEKNVEETINKIAADNGGVDMVINNAGIDFCKSVEEISYEEWQTEIKVNLWGPFHVSKAVYGLMKQKGRGHIINITSTAARRAWPNASAYHASKWGLLGFSHALHTEARKDNIKVTALIAGGMKTPFILDRFPDVDPDVLQDPANVAETIRFILCQPESTVIPEVMVIPMKETSWP